jgi:hypothetical protein
MANAEAQTEETRSDRVEQCDGGITMAIIRMTGARDLSSITSAIAARKRNVKEQRR